MGPYTGQKIKAKIDAPVLATGAPAQRAAIIWDDLTPGENAVWLSSLEGCSELRHSDTICLYTLTDPCIMADLSLPISTTLACALLAWLLILSWRVIQGRRSSGASLGDGGDTTLERRIRAQGNLTEYAPLFVVLIAILELQGGSALVLSCLSLAFVLGRLGHGVALAFTTGNVAGRIGGMLLTLGSIALAVLYGVILLV